MHTQTDMDVAAAVASTFFADPSDRSPKGSAMSVVEAEREARARKTERLRALRLAQARPGN
jgi:hypothetical protein